MRIGFIGVGNIGNPMARHLLAAGHSLVVHDLRREAGSRWMDAGVPLATIQRWLGHTNIAQTSTYLAGTSASEHDAMRQYEERRTALQEFATGAKTGGRKRLQSAAPRDRKVKKSASNREPAIM